MNKTKRGIVFTIDTIIGVIITASLLTLIMGIQNSNENDEIEMLKLQAFARDALATMDKQNILKNAFSQSDHNLRQSLDQFLNNTTPENINLIITVRTYRHVTSGSCGSCDLAGNTPIDSFCLCRSVSSSAPSPSAQRQKTAERRMFSGAASDQMGMATIEAGLK